MISPYRNSKITIMVDGMAFQKLLLLINEHKPEGIVLEAYNDKIYYHLHTPDNLVFVWLDDKQEWERVTSYL